MKGAPARYDEIAGFYDGVVGDAVDDPATGALLDLAGFARRLRLLDLACGQGRIARELARRGARVVGVDISEALLDKARAAENAEPLGISYLHADVTSPASLAGEIFDGVVCNFGLSDIDDLAAALATIARVLRTGGWFALSILHPCFPGWDADAPSSWRRQCGAQLPDQGLGLCQRPRVLSSGMFLTALEPGRRGLGA